MMRINKLTTCIVFVMIINVGQAQDALHYIAGSKEKGLSYNYIQNQLVLKSDYSFDYYNVYILRKGSTWEFIDQEKLHGTWKKEENLILSFSNLDSSLVLNINKRNLIYRIENKRKLVWKFFHGNPIFWRRIHRSF